MGWRYPQTRESLEYYIESKKLYPVTVLTTMNNFLNRRFREEGLVLIQDLIKFTPQSLANKFYMKEGLANRLIQEAESLID